MKRIDGRLRIALAIALALAVLMAIAFAHRLHDMTRGTPVRSLHTATADGAATAVADVVFAEVVSALAAVQLMPGHGIEILLSGDASFSRMFVDLRAARRSITFQSYYCEPGQVADTLVAILAERARSGTRVLFLADGFGCRSLVAREGGRLREAGVEVAVLRTVRWTTLHKAQHRSHVRLVVIDALVAYTGGFGVSDKWTTDGSGWRDTNVRFTGPAVLQAQGAFAAGWAEATGHLLAAAEFLTPAAAPLTSAARFLTPAEIPTYTAEILPGAGHPAAATPDLQGPVRPAAELPPPGADVATRGGGMVAGLQFASPGIGTTPFERLLFLSVAGARERLYITTPYFVPSAPVRALLAEAAARGVDVRVLTAGRRTDVPSTFFAAQAYYDDLLSAGIRIFEYQPTLIHAKTFVVDGVWSAIGSMNIDNRSLRLNDEVNLLILAPEIGRLMDDVFIADLALSREITLELHRERPRLHRILERAVRVIAPLL